jgi:hypothetical protein
LPAESPSATPGIHVRDLLLRFARCIKIGGSDLSPFIGWNAALEERASIALDLLQSFEISARNTSGPRRIYFGLPSHEFVALTHASSIEIREIKRNGDARVSDAHPKNGETQNPDKHVV